MLCFYRPNIYAQYNCIFFVGSNSNDIHKSELILVQISQILKAGPVPRYRSPRCDRDYGHNRVPEPVHENEHEPADLPAVQPVRHLELRRLVVSFGTLQKSAPLTNRTFAAITTGISRASIPR